MNKWTFPLVLIFLGTTYADTIEVLGKGTKQDGVYVIANSSGYVVADPNTGKLWSVPKSQAKVTISSDHVSLGQRWKETQQKSAVPKAVGNVQHPTENEGNSDSRVDTVKRVGPPGSSLSEDLVVHKNEKGTVVIKHKGNFVPDPAVDERLRRRKQEIDQSLAEDRAARQQAAAEAAAAQAWATEERAQVAIAEAQAADAERREQAKENIKLRIDMYNSERDMELRDSQIDANRAATDYYRSHSR